MNDNAQVSIDYSLYRELKRLGIINENNDTRSYNEGNSDYILEVIMKETQTIPDI